MNQKIGMTTGLLAQQLGVEYTYGVPGHLMRIKVCSEKSDTGRWSCRATLLHKQHPDQLIWEVRNSQTFQTSDLAFQCAERWYNELVPAEIGHGG